MLPSKFQQRRFMCRAKTFYDVGVRLDQEIGKKMISVDTCYVSTEII